MKKKLLIFHPIIAPYRIDLFNAMADHYDARVVMYWRNLKDQTFDYARIEEQMSFKPVYHVKDEMGTWRWLITMWRELSSSKPDCVLVSEFGILSILAVIHRMLTFGKYKMVCMTDDSYNILSEDNHFTRRHKKAINILAPRMDEIINVEPKSAMWYQEHLGKGIYFPIIAEDKTARERLQRVLPISDQYIKKYALEGKRVLLFVGRLVALKNLDFAIKAFIKAKIKDSIFIIVGSGPEEDHLNDLIGENTNILMVGRFEGDELYAWYNVAQVLTLQSTQEAFGAVTNEALIAGCNVLVSKDAGSNCLVKAGENGFVIDPRDEDLYINNLTQLMIKVCQINTPVSVKPNMMMISFAEAVEELFNKIDAVL